MKLREKIEQIINSKDWDKGTIHYPNLLVDLLTEYVSTLSKISSIPEDYILNKLSSQLSIIRFGNFKEYDNFIRYDNIPVNSDEFKDKYRKGNNNFGAINIEYNKGSMAICLFDKNNDLSGINLSNLVDIKHTLYHELTHVLEKSFIPNKNLIIEQNGSKIITANINPDKKYEQYVLEQNDNQILTCGLETIEYKSDGTRIVHNQISEGCTELIAQMILKINEIKIPHPERYIENVVMAKLLFKIYGENALKTYLTNSNKMLHTFLNKKINGTNLLFYADSYASYVDDIVSQFKTSQDIQKIYQDYLEYQQENISEEKLIEDKEKEVIQALKEIINYKKEIKNYESKNDNKKDTPFDKRSQKEVQVYQQIKDRNLDGSGTPNTSQYQMVRGPKVESVKVSERRQDLERKTYKIEKANPHKENINVEKQSKHKEMVQATQDHKQIKHMNNKAKTLTNNGNKGNKGFTDVFILSLIVSFVAAALFMIVYFIAK